MRGRLLAACFAAAMMLAPPAIADIAAYNKAVKAGDYKTANAEAGATWPQLDKTRDDIVLIAQEFSYAAYVAHDYAAMKGYAQFINGHASLPSAEPHVKALAAISLRLAEHKLQPSQETRNRLYAALVERAALGGFDNLSYFALDSTLAYDAENAKWQDAQTVAALGVKMATAGGAYYKTPKRRLELLSGVADYMISKDPAVYSRFEMLRSAVLSDMDQAASDEAAKQLKPTYYEISTWQSSLSAHIRSSRKNLPETPVALKENSTERLRRIFNVDDVCRVKPEFRRNPEFPTSAIYEGFVGAVLVEVDIDAKGKVVNPHVLAAVPAEHFGPAVLKMMKDITFKPNEWANADCKLERQGHRIEFDFEFGRPGGKPPTGSRLPG